MSSPIVVFQHYTYIANNLSSVLYGVYLSLYYLTIRFAIDDYRRTGAQYGHSHRLFVGISTTLLIMITLWIVEMWVVNKNYPGGAGQYYLDYASAWYFVTPSAVSMVLANAIADAFLLYRLTVIWSAHKVVVAVVPSLLYTGRLGVVTCVLSAIPRSDFFAGPATNVGLAYVGMSLGVNVYCTVLICARMWWFSRVVRPALGRRTSHKYLGAASIIIESMLPYTVFTIAYLVALGLESPLVVVFLAPHALFSVLSPQMVMLRVLMGRALTDAIDLPSVSEEAPDMESGPAVVHLFIVSQFSCTKSSNMNV
ncbi:uncharacterized protein BXZ73DRAFT_88845 [Epithele typhae]|uniref:uncharacterized protein n=1 Tax=Epithele typhae TaxID=378194 RepID=UPI0020078426|nr:uncharacterized protein BXZ73DRAFT_88845 [Epithele typhae]KAH9940190.1 hypothetical protein BXZ73DRAFT_88845 [Epithele typhae]